MALYCDVGTFTLNTSTGNQTVSFTPVGSVSYTPKFVEFWTVNVTGDGSSVGGAAFKFGYGAAVSSSERFCIYLVGADNVASGSHHRRHDDSKCFTTVTNAGAVFTAADFVSFGSNEFTINNTTASGVGGARVVHYRVWGGADLTNVAIRQGVIPVVDGVDTTFSSIGFTPTFAKILSVGASGAPPSTTTGIEFCMGLTDGLAQAFVGLNVVSATNANRILEAPVGGDSMFGFPDSSNNLDNEALFDSFGSGTMSLDWQDVTGAGNYLFGIFMAGPSFSIISGALDTTTGSRVVTGFRMGGVAGTPFTPKGLTIISVGDTGGTGVVSTDAARISYGSGVSNANRACVWAGSADASNPTIADNVNESDHILTIAREGTPTIDVSVDLDSFASDQVQLDIESTDGTDYFCIFEAAGDTVDPTPYPHLRGAHLRTPNRNRRIDGVQWK